MRLSFDWFKWLPWKYIVRQAARRRGFIDPIALLARFNALAQPAETAAPLELLRAGAVLHARGFLNNTVIQHNLDWVWPHWVERQFDPASPAFIPRAFSMTHINLTQRNWTAVGYPGGVETPIVDARGLLMPFFDSWSIDVWYVGDPPRAGVAGPLIVPARLQAGQAMRQELVMRAGAVPATGGPRVGPARIEPDMARDTLRVETTAEAGGVSLRTTAEVVIRDGAPVCTLEVRVENEDGMAGGSSGAAGWVVVSLRPYNPEGVSFVNDLSLLADATGWEVNRAQIVRFSRAPDEHLMARYRDGDVFLALREGRFNRRAHAVCDVGMITGAALYRVSPDGVPAPGAPVVSVSIPLAGGDSPEPGAGAAAHGGSAVSAPSAAVEPSAPERWRAALAGSVPRAFPSGPGEASRYGFLYEAALRTVVLLSPRAVYAGPYTYKRFWYRDAAIIIHALMGAGQRALAERALDFCVEGQAANGYFKSQEGEWDSNGQVLWVLGRYCRLFNVAPKPAWLAAIRKGVQWIRRKRLPEAAGKAGSGLMPAGFSAEHLGPNDFYYWDDFWTVAGLRLAAEMLRAAAPGGGAADEALAREALAEADALSRAVDASLARTAARLGTPAMPASPHRRLDSGAVGSLAVGFPLQLWPPGDARLRATVDYLFEDCLVDGGFYHDINHSGINPYLTLHLAQCLLREGDARFRGLMNAIARLATATGQWPEAVHPQLGTGCMGDGQHAWAAAEWMMMVRNCALFEEEFEDVLVIGAGLSPAWCGGEDGSGGTFSFGPAPTRFGPVAVTLARRGGELTLEWSGAWFGAVPRVDVRFDAEGWILVTAQPGRLVWRAPEAGMNLVTEGDSADGREGEIS